MPLPYFVVKLSKVLNSVSLTNFIVMVQPKQKKSTLHSHLKVAFIQKMKVGKLEKVVFFQKAGMHSSYPQADEPNYFP